MPFSSGMMKNLTLIANDLVSVMRKNISQNRLPKAIDDSIRIEPATSSGDGTSIAVIVGGEDAPMATAYEYGSGEHATRGSPGTYPIEPKDADLLAFDWQPAVVPWGSPKFFGAILSGQESTEGKYFFHYVDHPGVEARPFIKPAVEETLPKMKKRLITTIKAEILLGTEKVTVIRA